jgi:anti-sigma factor RsiW
MTNDAIDVAAEARLIRIMRYRDGRLTPHEAEAVAAELAADPEAAEIAESFGVGDAAARSAWADLESGPVPLALARRVTEVARVRPMALPGFTGWRAAAAVVISLSVGAAAVVLMQHDGRPGLRLAGVEGGSASDPAWKSALATVLRQEPALAEVGFADGKASVAITRWFDTATAMRCAEYRIAGEVAKGGGIACRRRDGGWDVIEQDQ